MIRSIGLLLVCFVLVASAAFADDAAPKWYDMISISGYADGRVQYRTFTPDTGNSDDEEVMSDVRMFEAAIAPHVQMSDKLSADAVFYYIDGTDHPIGHYTATGRAESLSVDEFYITYACTGVWAKIGKYYPPVGNFKTYGIGYTRVQDLFWTRVSAAGVGYDYTYERTGKSPFGLGVHAFNGDFDNVSDKDGVADPVDNGIDNFAANLYISPLAFMKDDAYAATIGGYFLSDATETLAHLGGNLMPQDIAGTPADPTDDAVLYESDVPLYGAYLNAELAFSEMIGVGVAAEYATTGTFDKKEFVDAAGDETAITATHAELALLFDNKRLQVGGKYGANSGLDWLGSSQFNAVDPSLAWEPNAYSEFGGFIGASYIDHLHLVIQYLAGSDNENNTVSLAEFQAKVVF